MANPRKTSLSIASNGPLENARRMFLDYVRSMNELRERPSFYKILTIKCTTSIFMHSRMNPESRPLSWKIFSAGMCRTTFMIWVGSIPRDHLPSWRKISYANARASGGQGWGVF